MCLRFGLKKNGAVSRNGNAPAVKPPPAPAVVAAPAPGPTGVGFVDFSDDLDVDLDDEDDDDLIDEDDLLGDDELNRPIPQRKSLGLTNPQSRLCVSKLTQSLAPECRPQPGKKRRACADCTCGLAERLAKQDATRRAKADKQLNVLKLKVDDMSELDFTVQGKTGSCGSCSLGDAFRCEGTSIALAAPSFLLFALPISPASSDSGMAPLTKLTIGCPYIGLPAFKPGEEVKLLSNIAQF